MKHHEAILRAWDNARAQGLELVAGDSERGFSWYPCDMCGQELGGDRYQAFEAENYPGPAAKFTEIEVCPCCYVALANGDITACAEYCGEYTEAS